MIVLVPRTHTRSALIRCFPNKPNLVYISASQPEEIELAIPKVKVVFCSCYDNYGIIMRQGFFQDFAQLGEVCPNIKQVIDQ